MHAALTKSIHARLGADTLGLCARGAGHCLGNLAQVDPASQVHLARVNAQNLETSILIWGRKLDFAVNATRTEQRRVENINAVGRHDDLDVLGGLKTIELVEQLQHGALDLAIAATTAAAVHAARADGINLIHKDDRGGLLTSHDEELADHAGALANVLLDQLGAGHANKGAVCVMCNGAGKQGLAGARGAVKQDALGLGDTKGLEELRVLDGELDDLLDLLDLLVETANHLVRAVGDLFDHHERDQRVNLARQDFVQRVAIVAQCHSEVGRELCDIDAGVEVDNVLAVGVDLDQNLCLAHDLDHLANVRAGLVEQRELLAQHAHFCVELIALGLEAPQIEARIVEDNLQAGILRFVKLGEAAIARAAVDIHCNGRHRRCEAVPCESAHTASQKEEKQTTRKQKVNWKNRKRASLQGGAQQSRSPAAPTTPRASAQRQQRLFAHW
eukprot:m.287788 g.287788  ORF g.287788 m.287788 type:complete len:445 (-) comp11847_c0_seq1:145-1479(-)